MPKKALLTTLNSFYPLSSGLETALQDLLFTEKLSKKHVLLEPGQTEKRLYFIHKGCARAYYYDTKGRECTNWFMLKGDFLVSGRSFYRQLPALEYIELLEDSELVSLTWEQLQDLYRRFPELNHAARLATERYLISAAERAVMLRTPLAIDRYQLILKNHPGILNKVPLGQIASYLGIKQETLSRIRAKLAKQGRQHA